MSAEVVPHLQWPGAAQVARIERTREIGGKTSVEVAYIVTSLPAAEAGHERLPALSRGHWGIENKLRWVRDVSMNEDRCRVHAGARALAALRNLVLWLSARAASRSQRPARTSARTAQRQSPW